MPSSRLMVLAQETDIDMILVWPSSRTAAGQLDGGPEPAVELGGGGGEARDPDPGVGRVLRCETAQEDASRLVSLVVGELA